MNQSNRVTSKVAISDSDQETRYASASTNLKIPKANETPNDLDMWYYFTTKMKGFPSAYQNRNERVPESSSGRPSSFIRLGIEGPYTSASSNPTRSRHSIARATARFTNHQKPQISSSYENEIIRRQCDNIDHDQYLRLLICQLHLSLKQQQ